MSAKISGCGRYRYLLTREGTSFYEPRLPAVFIMLNPSTADAELDDATIRRCRGFARDWGCDGIIVANLYAFRARHPHNLWASDDPVGPENDKWLKYVANSAGNVVCAWGTNAKRDRVEEAMDIFWRAGVSTWCLGTTKAGSPRHPLYVKADQPLLPWPVKTP
jgi:hypothetical protein